MDLNQIKTVELSKLISKKENPISKK